MIIDLHTHILPDWDDGARSEAEARRMVEIAAEDGIEKICLTPHVFRMTKHGDNLGELETRFKAWFELWAKRGMTREQAQTKAGLKAGLRAESEAESEAESKAKLEAELKVGLKVSSSAKEMSSEVCFVRGAEIYVRHDLSELLAAQPSLRINGGSYFFIELPSEYPVSGLKELFFEVMLRGFTPIISHPERCAVFRERPGLLYELINMGALAQVTAMSLEGEFGPSVEKAALNFLRHDLIHVIASDAHDGKWRVPRLSRGVERASQVVGREKAEAMVSEVPEAIINDRGLPDLWNPRPPRP